MDAPLPPALDDDRNRAILSHLEGLSAHSDIAQPLCMAVHGFPGAAIYCPDFDAYGYVVIYANERIFAFAEGMHGITLRLPPESAIAAIDAGATRSDVGDHWYFFPLFGSAGFEASISDWIALAYTHALQV
ncbi:MAG: hypothetical protein ABL934_02990 [Lysobacteraceae bacterium]